jgi:hypothetical protein
MTTATITMIYCVQQATGTDFAVNEAIAGLPEKIVPAELGVSNLLEAVQSLPGVISAIDTARSDPDDLYITTSTVGSVDNAIWPGPGSTVPMQAGQSQAPQFGVDFTGSQNFSLWDRDSISDDDLLGSVTVLESEQGSGEIAKRAASNVEGSVYYVSYTVD